MTKKQRTVVTLQGPTHHVQATQFLHTSAPRSWEPRVAARAQVWAGVSGPASVGPNGTAVSSPSSGWAASRSRPGGCTVATPGARSRLGTWGRTGGSSATEASRQQLDAFSLAGFQAYSVGCSDSQDKQFFTHPARPPEVPPQRLPSQRQLHLAPSFPDFQIWRKLPTGRSALPDEVS